MFEQAFLLPAQKIYQMCRTSLMFELSNKYPPKDCIAFLLPAQKIYQLCRTSLTLELSNTDS
jgi:hypothetical protein